MTGRWGMDDSMCGAPQQLRGAEHDAAAQQVRQNRADVPQVEAHAQLPPRPHPLALLVSRRLLLLVQQAQQPVPLCEAGGGVLACCLHGRRRRLSCHPICWGALLFGPVDALSSGALLLVPVDVLSSRDLLVNSNTSAPACRKLQQ